MKFDTVITGGGLAGLICGIRLQKQGHRCAIISAGQNAMHFSSGYFDMLNRTPDGKAVERPLEAVESLGKEHPYSKIGRESLEEYASQVKGFFMDCGILLNGDPHKNGCRITPVGNFKPTWLALEDFPVFSSAEERRWKKVLIANIEGFLDFNTSFLAEALEEKGIGCRIIPIRLSEMERLRKNPSEMRATNIARVMQNEEVVMKAVGQIKNELKDEDAVLLPAIFGMKEASATSRLQDAIGTETVAIATMPPSVPGIRSQMMLKETFEKAGGTFLQGDTACSPEIKDGRVISIGTVNFSDIRLYADNFVLASGSFFSKGLAASPSKVSETVFGLDVDFEPERKDWYNPEFFGKQAYLSFGVKTDSEFRCYRNGECIENLYAAGSILSGSNPLYEGSGAGTAIFSAFKVSDNIIKAGK